MEPVCFVGCAGWSLRKEQSHLFPETGTHLERYSQTFNAVEINSSFYRHHKKATYVRWKESVPKQFRFSVKAPKEATHTLRLKNTEAVIGRFIDEISGLEEKLGVVLVQLPPSLVYDEARAQSFFLGLRNKLPCPVALEPRHRSWASPQATELFDKNELAIVVADPAPVLFERRNEDGPLHYFRWHGSPEIYYSSYPPAFLEKTAAMIKEKKALGHQVWTIFDNTALGHAVTDAARLKQML